MNNTNNTDERLEKLVSFQRRLWNKLPEAGKRTSWLFFLILHTSIYKPLRQLRRICTKNKIGQEVPVTSKDPERVKAVPPSEDEWKLLHCSEKESWDIDVLIPVYEGYEETARCIYSVLTAKNNLRPRIIVVNDKSPNAKINELLENLYSQGFITLLNNSKNSGFVKSMNKAMRHAKSDILVWLNSDTCVYDGWLDEISAVLTDKNNLDIASVTPLSNNASLVSYPTPFQDNYWHFNCSDKELAEAARNLLGRDPIDAPTGHGFCIAFRKNVIDQIGFLNEQLFKEGYGEEVDLCLRIKEKGYRNVVLPTVFIRHYGATSFKESVIRREKEANLILNEIYPYYHSSVMNFISADPLKRYRALLDAFRLKNEFYKGKENILLITHNNVGGSFVFLESFKRSLIEKDKNFIEMRPQEGGTYRINCSEKKYPNLQSISVEDLNLFISLLKILGVEKVFLNHGLGYSAVFLNMLPTALKKAEIPLYTYLHDYFPFCHDASLCTNEEWTCKQIDLNKCERCCLNAGATASWRRIEIWERIFRYSAKNFLPSKDQEKRYKEVFPGAKFVVLPVMDDLRAVTVPKDLTTSLLRDEITIGVIGAISKKKGLNVIAALSSETDVPVYLAGYSSNDNLLAVKGVKVLGKYQKTVEVYEQFATHNVNVILIPSIIPETYCFCLSIALRSGLPVFVFDCGAQAERMRALGFSDFILPLSLATDPKGILSFISAKRKYFHPVSYEGNAIDCMEYLS